MLRSQFSSITCRYRLEIYYNNYYWRCTLAIHREYRRKKRTKWRAPRPSNKEQYCIKLLNRAEQFKSCWWDMISSKLIKMKAAFFCCFQVTRYSQKTYPFSHPPFFNLLLCGIGICVEFMPFTFEIDLSKDIFGRIGVVVIIGVVAIKRILIRKNTPFNWWVSLHSIAWEKVLLEKLMYTEKRSIWYVRTTTSNCREDTLARVGSK